MLADTKRAITTIMARRSAKGENQAAPAPMKPEVAKTENGEPDGRHAAAQDMIAAFHEKSPQKLAEAMANFFDLHQVEREKASRSEDDSKE